MILRISAPLDLVDETVSGAQRAVIAAGILAFGIALLVSYFLSRAASRPIVLLSERARALARGDFSQRVPRNLRIRELNDLASAFNTLTDELESRIGELTEQRDEVRTLVESVAEGIMALTADGRVSRVNESARKLLGLPSECQGLPLGTVVRNPELRGIFGEAGEKPVEAREISVDGRSLVISGQPLHRGGAVLSFLDVSELRRLEGVRRDFVANASHELKTPLTAIRGFAEALMDEAAPVETQLEFLAKIRGNSIRLQRLVDDLLDLSRIESGGWIIEPESVDVMEVAEDVWSEFEGRAQEKNVAFLVQGEAQAEADDQSLRQVFRNLFENALRHTEAGGEIRVSARAVGGLAEVEVVDTGAGIPARALSRIFERFYRVDPSRSRQEGGTGLGLAIVKHLVESMGGGVRAKSALGEGTSLHFTLPLSQGG